MRVRAVKDYLFHEITNTASVGDQARGLESHQNRLNASVKEIQKFQNFLQGIGLNYILSILL